MKPKEKKEIRLILKIPRTANGDRIYSVEFSARDIAILSWVYDFKSCSSFYKTDILKEVTTVMKSLSHYSFIIVTKEDSPKEEIDFMNEIYDMLINHGNDVLFEGC